MYTHIFMCGTYTCMYMQSVLIHFEIIYTDIRIFPPLSTHLHPRYMFLCVCVYVCTSISDMCFPIKETIFCKRAL